MQVVYSDDELLHNPLNEMTGGEWKPYVESPKRLVSIKNFIDRHPEFEVVDPNDYSLGPILDIHRQDYVCFLQSIYEEWVAEGKPAEACLGETFSLPAMTGKIDPEIVRKTANKSASGKMGYYTCDLSVCFVKNTWRATYASAQVAISAAHRLTEAIVSKDKSQSIYALCRPPGHHSSHQMAAGYCFVNNAAVVARFLQNYTFEDMNKAKKPYGFDLEAIRKQKFSTGTATEKKKILIVDIDYHHGNGTQDIFYDDSSVFYVSLHGSPDYPYFTGSAEETGRGEGIGYNINIPLDPKTTTDAIYLDNLERVLNQQSVVDFKADIIIVSMGLDTWHEDPIAGMKGLVDMKTYRKMGSFMKTSASCIGRPVLFVQEGGYTVEKLGDLAGNVLQGYLET
ncbi:hypothetical protein BDF21DRAFT_415020 [Thamnidium elegans]|uniref:Histone deacetylase domain-containing protein n=1 Tax=Thamnidium elegans TaxID=101142 RepID=A0A8H7SL47_9FUNG|nr:hypothetical protein INT48_009271 [Thamnidium elegans]KAI8085360.1 hypothetical protein BDF21DRAFT_415020 [Thamnidium elegans]